MSWSTTRLHKIAIAGALATGLTLASSPARSEQWSVINIQSDYGYGRTIPIKQETIDLLQAARGEGKIDAVHTADDKNNANIPRTLAPLKDGDVLVINTHSNAEVFGVGHGESRRLIKWTDFHRHWGRGTPPKLSLVMIHGCIYDKDENDNVIPATEAQLQAIRRGLNASAIISYVVQIHPYVGRKYLHGLIKNTVEGQKIASLIKGDKLRFLTAKGVSRDAAALDDLIDYAKNEDYLSCLCRCREPKGGQIGCSYDTTTRDYSPSCRILENGPCLCKNYGCFRAKLPASGECRQKCEQEKSGDLSMKPRDPTRTRFEQTPGPSEDASEPQSNTPCLPGQSCFRW